RVIECAFSHTFNSRKSVTCAPLVLLIANCQLQLLVPLIRCPNLHTLKPCWRGAVAGTHRLHGLAFATVGCTPQRPLVAGTDGLHGIPELGSDAGIGRVLEHPAQLSTFDFPTDLASELEVVALVVDRPGAVGLHVDAVVNSGDELVE